MSPAVDYRLAVDLGTTFTAAATDVGGTVSMVGLGNRALQVPSVLFLNADGKFLVGEAAERRGAAEPDRVVREFKRRIGDHVPILVAGTPYSPQALTARLLRWVVDTTTEQLGGAPASVVLTHPANWGHFKLDVLAQAAHLADLDQVQTCPEPLAAAARYAARNRVDPGHRVAVYDLGGGTFDVCVLEQTDDGFRFLGSPEGVEQLGGIDFDEALLRQVTMSLDQKFFDLDLDDPAVVAGLARLRRDCVEAKEGLSTDVDTVVPVSLPGLTTSVRVTRSEFESLIRPSLQDTIAATQRALRSAGIGPGDLSAILLAGGSSRIPLVGELLQREFGAPTALDTHPKHDVASGALRVSQDSTSPAAVSAPKIAPKTAPTSSPNPVPNPEPQPVPQSPSPQSPSPQSPSSQSSSQSPSPAWIPEPPSSVPADVWLPAPDQPRPAPMLAQHMLDQPVFDQQGPAQPVFDQQGPAQPMPPASMSAAFMPAASVSTPYIPTTPAPNRYVPTTPTAYPPNPYPPTEPNQYVPTPPGVGQGPYQYGYPTRTKGRRSLLGVWIGSAAVVLVVIVALVLVVFRNPFAHSGQPQLPGTTIPAKPSAPPRPRSQPSPSSHPSPSRRPSSSSQPNKPKSDPRTLPKTGGTPTSEYNSKTRLYDIDGVEVTMPGPPFKITSKSVTLFSTSKLGITAFGVVHSNYNSAGNDWDAAVEIDVVDPDLTGTSLDQTADKILSAWQRKGFGADVTTVENKTTTDVAGAPRPALRITATVHYSVAGVTSKYDVVNLVVAKGRSGEYVAFVTSTPNDSGAQINTVMKNSIKSLKVV